MKKTACMLLVLMVVTFTAYAGDELEVYLADDGVKIFTASISKVSTDSIDIKVIRKIKGDVSEDQLLTLPYFKYDSRKDSTPEVNDNCLMTMKKDKIAFKIQTTSTDPKTLRFMNHLTNISMNMEGKSVYERIEKYVNDAAMKQQRKEGWRSWQIIQQYCRWKNKIACDFAILMLS